MMGAAEPPPPIPLHTGGSQRLGDTVERTCVLRNCWTEGYVSAQKLQQLFTDVSAANMGGSGQLLFYTTSSREELTLSRRNI